MGGLSQNSSCLPHGVCAGLTAVREDVLTRWPTRHCQLAGADFSWDLSQGSVLGLSASSLAFLEYRSQVLRMSITY